MINVLVGGYSTAQLIPLCLPIQDETAFLWGVVMLIYIVGTPCRNCRKRICLSEVAAPCRHCGYDALTGKIIEPEAREIEVETREIEGTKCVNCPEVVPSFLDSCPSCGWEKQRQAA